eukprot:217890-Pyramimonas_sp.AAC.1
MWTRFAPGLAPTFNQAFQSARALARNVDPAALAASCTRVYTSTKNQDQRKPTPLTPPARTGAHSRP